MASSWFANSRQKQTADLRLFCFPYAGDLGSAFYRWPDLFRPAIDVYPIVLPGRGIRSDEVLMRRIDPLLLSLRSALDGLLDRPFAFFGHSLGALLAYELACHLAVAKGPEPVALFVSGRRAAHLPPSHREVHALAEDEFIEAIGQYNGTPPEILLDPNLMSYVAPVLRADLEINETYTYRHNGKLNCEIMAFGGESDVFTSADELSKWTDLSNGKFTLQMMPGDHFFLRTQQAAIISILKQKLEPFCGKQE